MRFAIPTVVAALLGPAISIAEPAGEVLSPKGGHFAVRFPGKAKESAITTKTPVGEVKVYTATYATAEGNVLLLSHTDFPAEAIKAENRTTFFAGLQTGMLGKDGKLVSEKEIFVGPDRVPGREIVIDKGKHQTRFRFVVKGTRLFQIAAVGTGEFVTGKDTTAYLDSFALVE